MVQQINLIEFWSLLAVSGIIGLLLDRIVSGIPNQNTGFAHIKFLHTLYPGILWIINNPRKRSASATASPMNSDLYSHELKLFFQRNLSYHFTDEQNHENPSEYQSDFRQKTFVSLRY